jgi:hypothetical protein
MAGRFFRRTLFSVSSRIEQDAEGRPVVVDHEGRRYRVVGDQVAAGGTAITFMAVKTGKRKPMPKPGPDGWVVGEAN